MLNGYVFASVVFALTFIGFGSFVLLRNSKSSLNRYFFVYSASFAIWLVANYLAADLRVPEEIALIANKVVFVCGGAIVFSLLLFVANLTNKKRTKLFSLVSYISLLAVVFSPTPLIVAGIFPDDGIYALKFGPLAFLYFLILPVAVAYSIYILVKARKNSTETKRSQIDVILYSFSAGLFAILLTNAFLPFVFNFYGLTQIGSFFSAFLIVGLGYAVIRHKLFDLRLIVARSVAYATSLGLVVGGYVFISVNLADLLGRSLGVIANAGIIVVAIIAYPYVKSYFDRITNKIFYRDAYDPQELLDELNQSLVSNIELNVLLRHTTSVIEKYLKSTYARVVLFNPDTEKARVTGDLSDISITEQDLKYIRSMLPKVGEKTVMTDELENRFDRLKMLLVKNDISTISRLRGGSESKDEAIAYLIMGPKKSGNIYNSTDIKILDIVTDELVIAIQNSLRFEEIQGFAATLQQEVNQATAKLKRTNEKLKSLDETKDEFISMASHQLRTPLTSVKGYMSMVLEGDAGELNKQQRELLNQAFVSSQRMVYLIADLLNVSRLKTGKFVIEANPTNLAEVIESEIAQLTEVAKSKKLTISYKKPTNFPTLMLDETKIRQVIMNFADNAIYYTPSGGKIDIELKYDKNNIYYLVKDNGLGVPKSEQKHLFTKFYRAKNARKARPDGTGLGLFMAKKVVSAQGGDIVFESKEGKGSTFGFTFQIKKLLPAKN